MTSPDRPRLVLEPPPRVDAPDAATGPLGTALPVVGSIGSVALLATSGGEARTRALVAAALFLLATVGFVLLQVDRQRQLRLRRAGEARSDYLHHLARAREAVRDAARAQRETLLRRLPPPAVLPALAALAGLAGRTGSADRAGRAGPPWAGAGRAGGPLPVRWGLAPRPPALELVAPPDVPPGADPVAADSLRRLLALHRSPAVLPAALDLRACAELTVAGPPDQCRALARSVVCSAALAHPPDALAVAWLGPAVELDHWDWLKWLPHATVDGPGDAGGPPRLVCSDGAELAALLRTAGTGHAPPHLLLVLEAHALLAGTDAPAVPVDVPAGTAVTALRLVAEADTPSTTEGMVITLPGRRDLGPRAARAARAGATVPAVVHLPGSGPVAARADQCDAATAVALARRLAPHRGHAVGASGADPDLPDALLPCEPARGWRQRPAPERLRVVLGRGTDAPVHLDLKEPAERGDGPHGLVVGATGSGKSELLRTVVLGLAATHPPEELNLVLVDFKGGATFAGLGGLPHVAASITNLAEEVALVDRMQDALSGEVVRRQEALRAAGDLASVRDHEAARRAGAALEPLPTLLVVVDEFTELLSARPELLDLFVTLGRIGRSLGVHLLLATQRLEEGRLRGLESHLSYRIALRTTSPAESRAVLGVPDAAALPTVPGLGLLRAGAAAPVAFRAGHVSRPVPPPGREQATATAVRVARFAAAPAAEGAEEPGPTASVTEPSASPSVLDTAVSAMAEHAVRAGHRPARRVWLPPLDRPATLTDLLPDLTTDPAHGLVAPAWHARTGLALPLGLVDLPREQRRAPLVLDLAGTGGHVGVVGGPRSGRSTTLRTLVCGLALTRTPPQAQVLLIDLAGGGLAGLEGLPHVAAAVPRSDPEGLRRVVAQVCALIDRREAWFAAQGVRDAGALRARPGDWGDGWGEVLLVVDGWSVLRAEHEDVEATLLALAGRGLALGVHLVLATHRWSDVRPALRDLLGSRIELRLGDPLDSEIDRRVAARVPVGRPGRGLVAGGHHVLTALPRLDDGTEADLVARVAEAWCGPPAPRLRPLPARIALVDLRPPPSDDLPPTRAVAARPGGLLLGVAEGASDPVALDLAVDHHLLVLGDAGSGRTTVLRTCLHELVRTRTAVAAQVVLLDPRRSLLGAVPDDHLLDDLPDHDRALPAVRALAERLRLRLPGHGTTTAQLRDRSWWEGPEVVVVADDHDLVLGPHGSPLAPLLPLLPRAGEIGLHLLLARRAAGAARTVPDPVPSVLRDLGAPGLLLSARPDDGPLLGLRPAAAPPGRGRLVGRVGGPLVVQVAWTPPGPVAAG